jgi:hypothetical protein
MKGIAITMPSMDLVLSSFHQISQAHCLQAQSRRIFVERLLLTLVFSYIYGIHEGSESLHIDLLSISLLQESLKQSKSASNTAIHKSNLHTHEKFLGVCKVTWISFILYRIKTEVSLDIKCFLPVYWHLFRNICL